jgi:hypothetical protein
MSVPYGVAKELWPTQERLSNKRRANQASEPAGRATRNYALDITA